VPPPAPASRSPLPAATPRRDRRRHRPLLAPFDLSRLRATLASHSLTPRRLARLLALPLTPATSLLLFDWYVSSLPLGPILAAADPDRALALLDSQPASRLPPLRESLLLSLLRSLPPGRALHLLDQMPPTSPSPPPSAPTTPSAPRSPGPTATPTPYSCTAGCSGTACRPPPSPSASPRALCRLGRAGDALAAPRDGAP
jgi:hypothetical protein